MHRRSSSSVRRVVNNFIVSAGFGNSSTNSRIKSSKRKWGPR